MEILYLLIPLSALLVLIIIGVFGWALHGGQFDDLEREGERILNTDGEALTVIKLGESSAPNNAPRVDSH
ncbi:cbb3-type cytochrome oxidase assembly protein CcoS [Azohydromonas lata]|uniref:Cbb3-type cytochrome oxidase assembly protein CcoS n=1 Tax=Azohydromonas lata TaxID=45677 RepID=A0ABU5IMF6_9BURK|nr:cbb3-type cytochrome oxidase assembly protein CcoS [Azohydromonas lata]MDZ5460034.1 cbb3-type cytochrome oxidase assembly protein CcoS [Azohydromonas lata]